MKPALLALFVALVLATAPVQAQSDPGETLRQVQLLIGQADRLSAGQQAARAREALTVLRRDPALADQRWLTEPLTASPPDLVRANARVTAALVALDRAPRPSANPTARAALAAVLADPRFHPTDLLSALPAWLQPLGRAIAAVASVAGGILHELLMLVLHWLGLAMGSPAFGPAMAALAVLVTAAVFLLYRQGLRTAVTRQAEVDAALLAAGTLPPTAAQAVAAAQGHAATGDYRAACHYLLLSVLLWVEERQGVRFDRAATNREHLVRLALDLQAARAALVPALEPVVQRFDRVWYGQATVNASDYAELAALAERVCEAVR